MKKTFNHINQASAQTPHARGWLTTFNDMITLMMVFFVLLFAMGNTDAKRFRHFQNSLQSSLGILHAGRRTPEGILSPDHLNAPPQARPSEEHKENQEPIDNLTQTQGIEAEYTPKGIQLILNDNLLFQSGSAHLTAKGLNLLFRVATVIKPLNRHIRIEGHTDNVPISNAGYASNWELSTARAVSVVKYFIQHGGIAPQKLSAAGYGASKPRVPNVSKANQAKNRRVEIILGQEHREPPADQQAI